MYGVVANKKKKNTGMLHELLVPALACGIRSGRRNGAEHVYRDVMTHPPPGHGNRT